MILGRFYFKLTESGNLLGEYSNNAMGRISTESADRIPSLATRDFIGNYNSTWFEQGAELLTLSISRKPRTNEMIFLLIWSDSNNVPLFMGEGFICENLLIGNYWDSEVQNEIGNRLIQP
jgi:hypothetical protein